MKPKNYNLISSYLRRLFATCKSINEPIFVKEMSNILGISEAKRLFNYYLQIEEILNHDYTKNNSRYYRWAINVHQDHFCPDRVRDIFLTYPIATVYKGRKKGSKNISIAAMAVSKEEVKIEEKQPTIVTLNTFSDKELIIELLNRGLIESIQIKVK